MVCSTLDFGRLKVGPIDCATNYLQVVMNTPLNAYSNQVRQEMTISPIDKFKLICYAKERSHHGTDDR